MQGLILVHQAISVKLLRRLSELHFFDNFLGDIQRHTQASQLPCDYLLQLAGNKERSFEQTLMHARLLLSLQVLRQAIHNVETPLRC